MELTPSMQMRSKEYIIIINLVFLFMADQLHVVRHILELDKLCFEQCISNYEKKFSVKEESCLKNCTTKVLNALDFMHSVN